MKISEILELSGEYLKKRGIESFNIDAQALVCFALGCSIEKLTADLREEVSENDKIFLRELIKKRGERIPLAYITGRKEFYGIDFSIDENCLVPRPETEFIVDYILKKKISKKIKILDICSGPGTILLSLIKNFPDYEGCAVDFNEGALKKLFQNAAEFGILHRVKIISADILKKNLNEICYSEKFDIIVCNPPYIPADELIDIQPELYKEPRSALFAEEKGLQFYNKLFPQIDAVLDKNGFAIFEISEIIYKRMDDLLLKIKDNINFELMKGYDLKPLGLVLTPKIK